VEVWRCGGVEVLWRCGGVERMVRPV